MDIMREAAFHVILYSSYSLILHIEEIINFILEEILTPSLGRFEIKASNAF